MMRYILALIIYVMALMQLSIGIQDNVVLSYNVYYDDVKIAYMEVHVVSDNVLVKLVPMVTLYPSDIELLKKLVTIPSKSRFYLVNKDISSYLSKLGLRIINTSMANGKLVLWYNVNGIKRRVEYYNGVLVKEESILSRHKLVISLIAVVTGDYTKRALTYVLPIALLIIIIALYAYVKREYIRIL